MAGISNLAGNSLDVALNDATFLSSQLDSSSSPLEYRSLSSIYSVSTLGSRRDVGLNFGTLSPLSEGERTENVILRLKIPVPSSGIESYGGLKRSESRFGLGSWILSPPLSVSLINFPLPYFSLNGLEIFLMKFCLPGE